MQSSVSGSTERVLYKSMCHEFACDNAGGLESSWVGEKTAGG
jgi:hypothetical protein